ncbi:extracellular solute-binding protein [Bacillus sp. FJAT-50079]|uniref:extracellular solute-binding protein n=1 Tax=Bacillus sp. FJAT-50079 TaxID=2833577 RepID=UPI001BC99DE1|nr:extracellular solute-binding protein [Bacillus sp. FJAT-50079]MBS4209339.1 extracellular solute-binding protein [Bacillus sp. FJAT-50079]
MKKYAYSIVSLLLIFTLILSGCSGQTSGKSGASKGDKPTTITIYTVAGGDEYYNDILIPMFEKETGGKYKIEYGRGTPQEVINKIKAQGKNGNIDLVITGLDGLPLGIEEGIWEQLVPNYGDEVHVDEWNEIAKAYIDKFDGYGAPITTGSGGPIIVYNEDAVKNPPTTYAELKDWINEHPNRFLYPTVPSSGPARGFFLGLVNSLGEDFNNPDSLDKTWNYLEEIGDKIQHYPTKTSDAITALYDGDVDIIPHVPFWFANNQVQGVVPPNIKGITLTDSPQIIDSHFYVMLKDLPEDRKKAALEFLTFATSKEAQSQALGVAFMPANKEASADLLNEEYKEGYNQLVEMILPEFKKDGELIMPEEDWSLFPNLEETTTLYKQWEEKIQSKK